MHRLHRTARPPRLTDVQYSRLLHREQRCSAVGCARRPQPSQRAVGRRGPALAPPALLPPLLSARVPLLSDGVSLGGVLGDAGPLVAPVPLLLRPPLPPLLPPVVGDRPSLPAAARTLPRFGKAGAAANGDPSAAALAPLGEAPAPSDARASRAAARRLLVSSSARSASCMTCASARSSPDAAHKCHATKGERELKRNAGLTEKSHLYRRGRRAPCQPAHRGARSANEGGGQQGVPVHALSHTALILWQRSQCLA
jgi:hypothetical protein